MAGLIRSKPSTRVRCSSIRPRLRPISFAVRVLLVGGAFMGASSGVGHAEPGMALPKPEAVLATMGSATYEQDGFRGVIRQTTDKAILNWKSFDIGPQNSVEFKQPAETSIALNLINERANPTQILGELRANGQVYLYNPNGFLFGKDSRVNVNSLVATTLNISEETFRRGVTKVFDRNKGQAAFEWTGAVQDMDHAGADGKPVQVQARIKPEGTGIQIEKGAQLSTNAPNRRILIVAPEVENQGTVSADDGEVILAAATDKLYLQEAPETETVTGLLVEVGKGGMVNNLGKISSRRGSITLAGFAVNQGGTVSATTSVRQNGSIRLLAREGGRAIQDNKVVNLRPGSTYRDAAGDDGLGQIARVTLGSGSITQVQPEYGDPTTAVDEQAQIRSRIEIYGKQVRFESAAQVLSPSGNVSVTGEGLFNSQADATPRETRIDMASGSKIDVSGLDNVNLPMERNVIEVELRGNELRDAPLQRNGVLRNQKIRVDVRKGTPLADISGATQRIGRTIEERSTTGGSVKLEATGAVVVSDGAEVNIAGGAVNYQSGYINTTQLISHGRVVDISQAQPDLIYEAILGPIVKQHSKFNRVHIWSIGYPGMQDRFEGSYSSGRDMQRLVEKFIAGQKGHREEAYTDGKSAGSFTVLTEALKLDGMINALTKRGVHQRTASTMPAGGSLTIDLSANQASGFVGQNVLYAQNKLVTAPVGPEEEVSGLDKNDKEPSPDALVLAGDFQRASGVGKAVIKTTGRIDIAKNTQLSIPETGALSLTGGQVKLAGVIDGPGARVDLATVVGAAALDSLDGGIELAEGSRIDTSGTWINDRVEPGVPPDFSRLAIIDGGAITVTSQGNLNVSEGSELAADGGAWLQQDGTMNAGSGGSISLASTAFPGSLGANLILDGSVHAYSITQGGSLGVTTNEVLIGEAKAEPEPESESDNDLLPLYLGSAFFSSGGFSHYSITSNLKGLTVLGDTSLLLQNESLELTGDYFRAADRRSLSGVTRRTVYPAYQRHPVDLTLALKPPIGQLQVNSSVRIEEGASIVADPKAHVSILSEGNIEIAGAIHAPTGTIDLQIQAPSDSEKGTGFMASQGIFLGGSASLDAKGDSIIVPDRFGFRTGDLFAGGSINLRADRGYILAEKGSRIDVSGSSEAFHLPTAARRGVMETSTEQSENNGDKPLIRVTPTTGDQATTVSSNGGAINLTAAEGMLLDGYLSARSGGVGAIGGSLRVELNKLFREEPAEAPFPKGERIIQLQAKDTPSAPKGWSPGEDIPMALNGIGQLAADTVDKGGFATLTVKSNDEIRFQESLTLDLERAVVLDAPVIGWSGADGAAHIEAAVVAVGSSMNRHVVKPASEGSGTLTMEGDLIDLFGATSLQGFREANFSSRGDIRFRGVAPDIVNELGYAGELQSAGNLTLQAAKVYPTTASTFSVNLIGANSTLTIQRAKATAHPLLSAGSDLTLNAPNILQSGSLEAPFGAIHLKASNLISLEPGSLTSTSGNGLLVPFGRTPGGLDWLYPMVGINSRGNVVSGDINLVFEAPPEKSIDLTAPSIDLKAGATIDISGGGDLVAFEFLPGLGGSVDVLDPRDPKVLSGEYSYQEKYAVLPSLKGGFAPYDHLEFSSSGLSFGDNIYLPGVNGLPEGEYPLLPAHYALLPGAFLVTPDHSVIDIQPGQQIPRTDGAMVAAGYRKAAGTSESPAYWSAFAVEPGAAARTRSEYQDQMASVFFDQQASKEGTIAASSVNDAGHLSLAVTRNLLLDANILAIPANGGRGGLLDIVAPNIAVVPARGAGGSGSSDGRIELAANDLNRLNMESLLLGAIRKRTDEGTELKVGADRVTVQSGASLRGPEIILTARDQVSIQGGGEVYGQSGRSKLRPNHFVVDGDAALLRVATGDQTGYTHGGGSGARGDLIIHDDAILRADGSMLLDSSRDMSIGGRLVMKGGDLAIYTGLINLGRVPTGAYGATLSDTLLGDLEVDDLALTGRDGVHIYGDLNLKLGSLVLDAPVLAGFNNPDVRISAESILLANGSVKTPVAPVAGSGKLSLIADAFEFGMGAYAIEGFSTIGVQGVKQIRFSGESNISMSGSTNLAAPRIIGSDGARISLDASGFSLSFDKLDGKPTDEPAEPGFGANFMAVADRIDFASYLALPSGSAYFTALKGDLNLLPGAEIDLAGRTVDFGGGMAAATPGGLLTLSSREGNVNLHEGTLVNLSGPPSSTAGRLSIAAPKGLAFLNGSLDASGTGGDLNLDAQSFQSFETAGFSSLNKKAVESGFDGSLNIRQRIGSLRILGKDIVKARNVSLTTDEGNIELEASSSIDASSPAGDAGEVILSAGGQVILNANSSILVSSKSGKGGKVELASALLPEIGKGLVLESGARIDVSGGEGQDGGDVHLRAMRNQQNDNVSVDLSLKSITGEKSIVVEAVKVETVDDNKIDKAKIDGWKASTDLFMAHSPAIAAGLGGDAKVLPGLEIRSAGSLALNQDWDLHNWRYVNKTLPGFLTIRAGGDIVMNRSLSDGFNGSAPGSTLLTDESWSLRLISGSDFGANWRQTLAQSGNLTLSSSALLRTGTGDIEIYSGNDIILSANERKDRSAAIYTAGRALPLGDPDRYGNLNEDFLVNYFKGLVYPEDGGNIRMAAGGDIEGAVLRPERTQFMADWQQRMGSFNPDYSEDYRRSCQGSSCESVYLEELPTAWAIRYDTFQQNLGALGGGDVNVLAGGDIRNLQVMLPTTGKQRGDINENTEPSFDTLLRLYNTNEVGISDPAKLTVDVRGDILGGQFYVGHGTADITAFGSITGGKPEEIQFSAGPLFAIGDATFRVSAAQDIALGAAYNPFALAQRESALIRSTPSVFIDYTDDSSLLLTSTAGGIDFRNDIAVIDSQYKELNGRRVIGDRISQEALKLYPGTLEATAPKGDITLRSINLYPSKVGNLNLLAGGDIRSDPDPAEVVVNLSDANPELFPSPVYPRRDLAPLQTLLATREPDPLRLPDTPLHRDDTTLAHLISLNGDINGNSNLKFFLSKPSYISAGRNVMDVGLNIQNMRPEDYSIVHAGWDLRYHINRGRMGELEELRGFGVQVGGPGQLHVLAGRDIDLGASDGISTTGNLFNISLDEVGASLSLLAGLRSPPAYTEFLSVYLGPGGDYRLDPTGDVIYPGLGDPEALSLALGLAEEQQRELTLLLFFNELKLSSQEAANNLGYERGNRAIAALFPDSGYGGDIKLFFSRIHTLDGGGIDLLAPGGLINAGLASAFVGEKKPSDLGVVTQRGGAVRSYTQGDFQVNQSRVFAISSQPTNFTPRFGLFDESDNDLEPYKDIIAWSAAGDIDAGRGSKSSLSVSGGKKGFDIRGNLTEEVPPTIDGSGIRAQISGNSEPGDVYLAAPKGVVDAGEAGIGGRGVTIAATAIVGAANIQTGSGDISSNVATSAPPAVVAPASASSAAASAGQMAEQSASGSASKGNKAVESDKPGTGLSIISADLVGFGNYSVSEIREGKFQPSGRPTAPAKPGDKEEDKKKEKSGA